MTRGLRDRSSAEDLQLAMTALVHQHIDAAKIVEIVFPNDGASVYDDGTFVEIRVILNVEPVDLVGEEIAVRRDLFDLFWREGDERVPLLQFISKSDYQASEE